MTIRNGILIALLFAGAASAQILDPPQAQVNAWYDFILVWVMKPVVGAALIGFFTSIVCTQRWKMGLPADMDHDQRRRKTQRFSFYVGFVVTLLFWPLGWVEDLQTYGIRGIYLILVSGAVVSAVVGATAPFVYAIVMNRLYKFGWFNEVAWSGEARADQKRSDGTD